MQRSLVVLGVIFACATAAAHPPPQCRETDLDCRDHEIEIATDPVKPKSPKSPYQWATWVRLAGGVASGAEPEPGLAARGATAGRTTEGSFEAALGADVTFAIDRSGSVRVGPWIEVRGLELGAVVGGGELVIQAVPRKLDLFWYEGQGVLAVRAGGNHERVTAQVAYGYLAPWRLNKPGGHYMIGVRFVGTVTRALDDAHTWTATIGLETEPVGALRYLLGIRSWYR